MRLATVALIAALGLAPISVRADETSRLVLAKQLVEQIHLSDTMRALVPVLAAQMRTTFAQQGHDEADAREYVAQFQTRAVAEMGRYTDEMARAYAQAFTEDELKSLIAFDDTPLGRKLIAQAPELAQASMIAGHRLGVDVGREVLDDMQAKKEKAKTQQKL